MRYEKQTFRNETVTLDGNEFIECTFAGCRFQYSGGDFNIDRIRFDSLEFTVDGPAARTVLLLQSLWSNEVGRQAVQSMLEGTAKRADA
ncbi:hypothetical protein HNQ60_004140 [Povalibacter uvarum]|uniref:Uncharacterized protein n=1 Tax=Povalibacter uvarum TaxID=732238 RepID=A0A841HSQ9_9GAMM|nr:hypothetical protein [Povalibacter uvarum]MBB6095250.1 hypothetical protein [Povalibacter uvarum]